MSKSLLINNIVSEFQSAGLYLEHRLEKDGIRETAIWGAGPTGMVVKALLDGIGIKVVALYDSHKTGDIAGMLIRDPLKPGCEFLPGVPVIIASSQDPKRLTAITDLLAKRNIPYYFARENSGDFLNLEDFIGIHKNQRCFVMGNGPSLNKLEMGRLKGEIVFGANRCFLGFEKWGISVKYWTIEDLLVAEDVREDWNRFSGPVKFIPTDIQPWVTNYENLCLLNFKRLPFYPGLPRFSDSPGILYWGGTVTYLMLQLAVIMGCNPIYLIGIDFHYEKPSHVTEGKIKGQWTSHGADPNHFDSRYFGKGRKWHNPRVDRMRKAFESARQYARIHGITILNATPGTHLEVFPRTNFKDCF